MTARPFPPGMPLTPENARRLDELVAHLTAEEALWVSGYLAGFARHARQPAAVPATSGSLQPLLILYGSETGHAEALARHAAEQAQARGLPVRCLDLADFRLQELKEVRHLLLFTSTYGDGDPPVNAVDFHEFVHGRKAPRLEGMKFAVLGLGDSSYERFCQTAKDCDHRFAALGATRLHERADCDVDYERQAGEWIDAALAAFERDLQAAQQPAVAPAPRPTLATAIMAGTAARRFDPKHPYPATIIANLLLNGRGSDKETRHIELSLAGSGLSWEPGDSLGILPENDAAVVDELLAALGLDGDAPVPDGAGGEMPLVQALVRCHEVTTLTPRFIELYGAAAGAEALRRLAAAGHQAALRKYLAGRHIIDVATEFPAPGLDAAAFTAMLRPLQPRLYSLACSPAAYPEEAHLTVAVVRYATHGRPRRGVASNYLERRGIDDAVPVHIAANKNFRLPAEPSAPIIMVGAGTGVAPFRAFLQHRQAAGAPGRNWLFFGDRRFRTDFLYQLEWQRLIRDKLLTRMDVAFSRDQEDKVYVQHRLLEQGRVVYAWLQEGAAVYVCGDASRMAPDVHSALTAVLAQHGGMSRERAEEYLKQLQRDKRYQRDVY